MNLRKSLSVAIVAIASFAAVSAVAQPKDSGDVVLHSDVTVGASHLASGNYIVQWVAHSPEATVTFLRGKKVVATAEGKVEDRGKRYLSNEVIYFDKPDGTSLIQELRFKGSSEVIVFQ